MGMWEEVGGGGGGIGGSYVTPGRQISHLIVYDSGECEVGCKVP